MFKNIIKSVLFIIITSTLSYAEIINIINENEKASIYINGQLAGYGNVYNKEISPGSHHIKVKLNNDIIYSKVVTIKANETTTIDTSTFISANNSDIPNKGASDIEAKRLRDVKGNLGIGYQFGPDTGGLSLRYWLTRHLGTQIMGWSNTGDTSFSGFYGRLLYLYKDKLVKKDSLNTLYFGIGAGSSSLEETSLVSFLSNSSKKTIHDKTITEAFVGVEYPWGSTFTYFEIAYNMVNETKTDEFMDQDTTGFKLNLGFHFYF